MKFKKILATVLSAAVMCVAVTSVNSYAPDKQFSASTADYETADVYDTEPEDDVPSDYYEDDYLVEEEDYPIQTTISTTPVYTVATSATATTTAQTTGDQPQVGTMTVTTVVKYSPGNTYTLSVSFYDEEKDIEELEFDVEFPVPIKVISKTFEKKYTDRNYKDYDQCHMTIEFEIPADAPLGNYQGITRVTKAVNSAGADVTYRFSNLNNLISKNYYALFLRVNAASGTTTAANVPSYTGTSQTNMPSTGVTTASARQTTKTTSAPATTADPSIPTYTVAASKTSSVTTQTTGALSQVTISPRTTVTYAPRNTYTLSIYFIDKEKDVDKLEFDVEFPTPIKVVSKTYEKGVEGSANSSNYDSDRMTFEFSIPADAPIGNYQGILRVTKASNSAGEDVTYRFNELNEAFSNNHYEFCLLVRAASGTTTNISNDITYGDANLDGKVSAADAVAILQSIGNSDKYSLSAEGKAAADVDGVPGITPKDALVIQQVSAGIYQQSDLPLKA